MASTDQARRFTIGFYRAQEPLIDTLDESDFHVLSTDEKRLIFESNVSRHERAHKRGAAILRRLSGLSAAVRTRYELKPDPIDKLTMRLWCPGNASPDSYICLSYCWNQSETIKPELGRVPLPISPLMFSAFAAQRRSNKTGLWVDQLCIDQNNTAEKAVLVGAMDAVYRCAELVVVVLHDVEVYPAQQRWLRSQLRDAGHDWWYDSEGVFKNHSSSPPFMQTHPVFKRFLYTILESKYFTRAWCSHELQMRNNYVFLIPCSTSHEGRPPSEIFYFTSEFLLYMVMLSTKLPVNEYGITNSTREEAIKTREIRAKLLSLRLDERTNPLGYDQRSPRLMPSYPARIRDIFGLQASGDPTLPADLRASTALLDKTTIVLNILNNGLGVRRREGRQVSEDECIRDLYMIGLSAHDPTTLCTMGQYMNSTNDPGRTAWLRQPSYIDLGCGASRQFPLPHLIPLLSHNIKVDPSSESRWIKLDVFAMPPPRPAQQRYRDLATELVQKCLSLDMGRAPDPFLRDFGIDPSAQNAGKTDLASRLMLFILESQKGWGTGPEYQYWYTQTFYGWTRERFQHTIACILECGFQWIIKTGLRCGYPAVKSVGPRLTGVVLDDMTWDFGQLSSAAWASDERGRDAVTALFSFANWMVVWGNDSPYGVKSGGMPVLFDHGPDSQGRAVVYGLGEALSQFVIPNLLLEDHYSRLYRVWLLAAKDDPYYDKMMRGLGAEWYLRGKAILFTDVMDGDTVALTEAARTGRPGWRFRPDVTIHGPPQYVVDEIDTHLDEQKPEERTA